MSQSSILQDIGQIQRGAFPVWMLLVISLAACEDAPSSAPSSMANPTVLLTDVTASAGLGAFRHDNGDVGNKWYPEQMGSGGGFLDYDGDGWLDILLMGGGNWNGQAKAGYRALWLYRNEGDGTFSDQTAAAGFADVEAYTLGLAAADVDNDGDTDVLLTNLNQNLLLRNEGGVFVEDRASGLSDHDEWSSSALFFDADRDGDLDLYVGNYADWTPETDKFCPEGSAVKLYCIPADYEGVASRYYVNRGDGTFEEQTRAAGIAPALGKSLGMAEYDFNQDGWSDFVVANDGEGDLLYMNNGDGTFTERGVRSGIAFSEHGEARAGMGIDVGVVDSSGEATIFVGNFSEEMAGVYRHLGNGLFQERAAASRIGGPSLLTLTFGLFLIDIDMDTDLDLFMANGHVYPDRLADQDKITFRQRPQLYLNNGQGLFDEYQSEHGVLTKALVARGAAYGDYDQDGDFDLLLTENDGPVHLWRNDAHPGHWLRIKVEGVTSNRDGYGTQVTASVGGLRMERRIRSGSSYLSQSEVVAAFGLGEATQVDTLTIQWPDGAIVQFEDVPANQTLLIREGINRLERVAPPVLN